MYMLYSTISAVSTDWPVQVQQEYRDLFETSAADPEALLRWRNRALRFVLPSEQSTPESAKASKSLVDCDQNDKSGTSLLTQFAALCC